MPEAVHHREHARSLGVPDEAILVEPAATNTGENLTSRGNCWPVRGLPRVRSCE
nr:ElyC/SanA/YdcF family protein [Nonomuraea coxensis]